MKRAISSFVLCAFMGFGANAAELTVNVVTGDIANVPRLMGEIMIRPRANSGETGHILVLAAP